MMPTVAVFISDEGRVEIRQPIETRNGDWFEEIHWLERRAMLEEKPSSVLSHTRIRWRLRGELKGVQVWVEA